MKHFSKWTIEEAEDEFHIVLQSGNDMLTEWMSSYPQPSDEEKQILDGLCGKLRNRVWDWNEEELKICFIAPLLNLVNFEHEKYTSFFSREISAVYKDGKLSGTADFMVASGRRSPKRPFFFINEYKKEHDSSDDPLGQLVIAMITAQKLNSDNNPVYGAYIMGRYWHFTVLHDIYYSVHTGLNAANDDIKQIFGVLKKTKQIIDNMFCFPSH